MGGAVKQVGRGRHEEWNVPQMTDLNGRGELEYKTCVAVFFSPKFPKASRFEATNVISVWFNIPNASQKGNYSKN